MAYNTLLLESENQITVLTLNKPQNKNSMTREMAQDFRLAIDEVKNDSACKALIITGQGDAFSSGGDLRSTFSVFDDPQVKAKEGLINFYQSFLSVRKLDIPTIAMINGYAMGAGLSLALACDMRIAALQAQMAMTFIKIGLHPGLGATYLLPRLVGSAKALEIFLTGKTIGAEEALRIGMINHAVPADELRSFTMDFAAQIARNPAVPAKYLKKAVYQSFQTDLDSDLDYEASSQVICATTEDMREGLAAFREKRKPVFKGK